MGRNSQQRRAHKQRKETTRQREAAAGDTRRRPGVTTDELITVACHAAFGPSADKVLFGRVSSMLQAMEVEHDPLDRPSARVQLLLQQFTETALESGWQPADLAHVVRREWSQRTGRLSVAFVAQHSRRLDAPTRAPHPWLAQLQDLGVVSATGTTVVGGHGDLLAGWARTERLHPDDALVAAVQLLAQLRQLPRLPIVITPPSKWGTTNVGLHEAATTGEIDEKALRVIRGLLAKAEATTFEAEAEAFTSKAQELMTRHSIDAAVVAQATDGTRLAAGVVSRRVHIDNPYADEKATFLSAIADVNGAKSVWLPHAGLCTVVGFPVDLQLTDLLFTSLLVQATRASAAATAANRSLSTASFRRAFLVSFAHRIAERLEAARAHVATQAALQYGESLLPVLASREAAVEAAYTEAFPNASPMRGRSLDAAGWHAGRAAADRADIGAGHAIAGG